jgi:hypothetical protein
MKFVVSLLAGIWFMASASASAGEPVELTAFQMDQITAGDLTSPGNQVFLGFDNPSPLTLSTPEGEVPLHPALIAYLTKQQGRGAEGPWQAHFNSDRIDCTQC